MESEQDNIQLRNWMGFRQLQNPTIRKEILEEQFEKIFEQYKSRKPKRSIIRQPTVIQEVASLKQKVTMLESKYEELEFQLNISKFRDRLEQITEFINKNFSAITEVISASYTVIPEGLAIMIVHQAKDNVEIIKKVRKIITEMKQVYPGIYFESWVLNADEITSSHFTDKMKTVFLKEIKNV